jgi:hypothetical protein
MSAQTHVSDWNGLDVLLDCDDCAVREGHVSTSVALRVARRHAIKTGHSVAVTERRSRRVLCVSTSFEAMGVAEFGRRTWDPRGMA